MKSGAEELPLPNLIIAGVGKSGTTSLFHYLAQHPDICAALVKEVKYFKPLRYGRPPGPIHEYARYFGHCGGQRYRLEATPAYVHGGSHVISAIKETLPDPCVIINLRDPGERVWESFGYMKSKHYLNERLTFDRYLDRCIRLRAAGVDTQEEHRFYRLSTGFYGEFVGEWLEAFGERLRIVFFDRLVTDPAATLRELCTWLDLDSRPVASFEFGHHNQTKTYRSRRLHGLALATNRAGARVLESYPAARDGLRRLYGALNAKVDGNQLRPQTRERLRRLFRESNERLASDLRAHGYIDLPGWLRDP